MDDRIRGLAQTLWDYHHVNHQLVRADAILVLCSHDKTVATRGAALFLDGWAPLLIFAGGLGAITRHLWHEPEADQFAAIAVAMAGLALLPLSTQALRSIVVDAPAIDLRIAVGAAIVLLLGALASVYWPARRAGRIDPAELLKAEQ